jgi:hypothetical protein
MQTCVEPQGYFPAASVDPTEARNDILGCFGRSDRRARSTDDEPPRNPGAICFGRTPQGTPTDQLGGSHGVMLLQELGDMFIPAPHGPLQG